MRKLFYIAAAIVFYISACTKIESTTIGNGLIPPIDGVNTFDTTLEVYTNTFYDPRADSAVVYKSDDHVIGIINNDPLFGTTTAEAMFELKPTFYKYYFPAKTTLVPDSAVLVLSYKGAFGDTSVDQKWQVFSLVDTLKPDTVYNVSTNFRPDDNITENSVADVRVKRLADSSYTSFEAAKNQVRIRLNSTFANEFIKTYDSTGLNPYSSDANFRKRFHGFKVAPLPGSPGNALVRVNLLDTNTKLALYYHYKKDDTATTQTAGVNYFRFSPGVTTTVSGSANRIVRKHANSELSATVNSNVNDQAVYIQTSPGNFATVRIPGLSMFPNALIHRAELQTVQWPDALSGDDKFFAPSYLLLSTYDSINRIKTNVPNDFIVGSGEVNFSTFGGYPRQADVNGAIIKTYTFDLSRYVQGIITRKDSNRTLILSAPVNDSLKYKEPYPIVSPEGRYYFTAAVANNTAMGRVKLGGGGLLPPNPYRMRLRIIYSRI